MNIGTNVRNLTHLFIILFLGVSGSLVYWQVIVSDQLTANPHNVRSCMIRNAPIRGRILDRNGIVLAESVLDKNASCGYTRRYTDNSLSNIIGYYVPGYLPRGIEAIFDDVLSGRTNTASGLNEVINNTLHRPPEGHDIYLTIDSRVQRIVKKRFDEKVRIDNSTTIFTNRGSVVVSDPKTGEVLSMLSEPGFDVNKLVTTLTKNDLSYYNALANDAIGKPLKNRAIEERYPPGSTYKAMTLLAALDSGTTTLNQPWGQKEAMGPLIYNGQQIGPAGNNLDYREDGKGITNQFPVSTAYGFSQSDNIIFAQLGVKMGYEKWLEYNKRFFVEEQIPFDLPVIKSRVLKNGAPLNDYELGSNAFGQGYDVMTPFQMSLFSNAIANDGVLMKPMLISKIVDRKGHLVVTYEPQSLGEKISKKAAQDMRLAMFGVSICGGGAVPNVLLNQSPWGIMSKTGTAQVDDRLITPAHSWLFTQAPYYKDDPARLPTLTIIGMKENGGEGGKQNGPMVSSIYNDVFSTIDGFKIAQAPGQTTAKYCCDAKLIHRGCVSPPPKKPDNKRR